MRLKIVLHIKIQFAGRDLMPPNKAPLLAEKVDAQAGSPLPPCGCRLQWQGWRRKKGKKKKKKKGKKTNQTKQKKTKNLVTSSFVFLLWPAAVRHCCTCCCCLQFLQSAVWEDGGANEEDDRGSLPAGAAGAAAAAAAAAAWMMHRVRMKALSYPGQSAASRPWSVCGANKARGITKTPAFLPVNTRN